MDDCDCLTREAKHIGIGEDPPQVVEVVSYGRKWGKALRVAREKAHSQKDSAALADINQCLGSGSLALHEPLGMGDQLRERFTALALQTHLTTVNFKLDFNRATSTRDPVVYDFD